MREILMPRFCVMMQEFDNGRNGSCTSPLAKVKHVQLADKHEDDDLLTPYDHQARRVSSNSSINSFKNGAEYLSNNVGNPDEGSFDDFMKSFGRQKTCQLDAHFKLESFLGC